MDASIRHLCGSPLTDLDTPISIDRDPISWAGRVLRLHGVPPEEIRGILESGEPEIVRRYLELHRERLRELLDDRLRTLDALEPLLTGIVVLRDDEVGDR